MHSDTGPRPFVVLRGSWDLAQKTGWVGVIVAAMLLSVPIGWVLLAVVVSLLFLIDLLIMAGVASARRREAERQAADERRKKEEAEKQKREEKEAYEKALRERPPPPTQEELAEAARQRYERKLRSIEAAGFDAIELKAAKTKARQEYLRELDGIL